MKPVEFERDDIVIPLPHRRSSNGYFFNEDLMFRVVLNRCNGSPSKIARLKCMIIEGSAGFIKGRQDINVGRCITINSNSVQLASPKALYPIY